MNKNAIYLFLLIFSFSISIKAQTITNFGLKAGVHLIDLKKNLDEVKTAQDESGFYLGGFLEFRKGINFSIQPEFLYSNSTYFTDRVSFFYVPILFKYHINDRIELMAGPETQFLLSIENTDTRSRIYKKFILGFDVGVGVRVIDNFYIDAKYSLGVSKFVDYGYRQNYKLNTIQAGIAYKFDE